MTRKYFTKLDAFGWSEDEWLFHDLAEQLTIKFYRDLMIKYRAVKIKQSDDTYYIIHPRGNNYQITLFVKDKPVADNKGNIEDIFDWLGVYQPYILKTV